MTILLGDIETDGLWDRLTKIHCLVIKDVETGLVKSYGEKWCDGPLAEGVNRLNEADEVWFHNGIRFDVPVLKRFFPWFNPKRVRDTMLCTKLIYPNLGELDKKAAVAGFPKNLTGAHSLEAWGHRLRAHKGTFAKTTDWKEFSEDMLRYCIQDVDGPTAALYRLIKSKKFSERAIEIEHDFACVMWEMERHGFRFDEAAAHRLHAQLVGRKTELEAELLKTFPGWSEDMKTPEYYELFVPNHGNIGPTRTKFRLRSEAERGARSWCCKKGQYTITPGPPKQKHTPFNPGSRDHIARALKERGWKPRVFTDGGKPQIDETVLEELEYPEAKLLLEYLMLEKRLGQLAEGDAAWLKLVEKDGRIHGQVDTLGTWTGRVAHKRPNMGQIPAVDKPYGPECRALFIPDEGHVLVGADASGIQLRALSHYLSAWDGGTYVQLVTQGDVHTANMEATEGIITSRNTAKTFIYCYLLGGGDGKIGKIVGGGAPAGRALRAIFLKKFPAFRYLKEALEKRVKGSGGITGLDGRFITCENSHFALAALLQSFECIVMKTATKLLYGTLTSRGWVHGKDWGLCGFIHDEHQISSRKEIADEVGRLATESIKRAGELLDSKCPLAGEYRLGLNWKETH